LNIVYLTLNILGGRSIGYISLAGHTFPDPRALEEMLQGMFQRSKENFFSLLLDDIISRFE